MIANDSFVMLVEFKLVTFCTCHTSRDFMTANDSFVVLVEFELELVTFCTCHTSPNQSTRLQLMVNFKTIFPFFDFFSMSLAFLLSSYYETTYTTTVKPKIPNLLAFFGVFNKHIFCLLVTSSLYQ